MNPAQELRERIWSYVDQAISLTQLREWLEEHAETLAKADDPALNELEGLTWSLISEHDYGHRDETSVRAELWQSITVRVVSQHGWKSEVKTEAGSGAPTAVRSVSPQLLPMATRLT